MTDLIVRTEPAANYGISIPVVRRVFRGFSLAICTKLVYIMCMRKRTNINLEDEDQAAIALIRRKYGATSDTAAIRFALRKILREEGNAHVPRQADPHWQDKPAG